MKIKWKCANWEESMHGAIFPFMVRVMSWQLYSISNNLRQASIPVFVKFSDIKYFYLIDICPLPFSMYCFLTWICYLWGCVCGSRLWWWSWSGRWQARCRCWSQAWQRHKPAGRGWSVRRVLLWCSWNVVVVLVQVLRAVMKRSISLYNFVSPHE